MLLFIGSLFVLSIIAAGFYHPITAITQDLGRHILTGKIIWETHSVPISNVYSYTYPNFPFINHHWFSEVLFYGITKWFGFNGLLIVTTTLAVCTFGILFFYTALRRDIHIFAVLGTSLLYSTILFERTDIRPELFSFLFLTLFVVLLYRFRNSQTFLIFLLIPLEFLWVNIHIYFLVGIIVIGLFFIDWVYIHRNRLRNRGTYILSSVFFGAMAATVINPHGISGALYPLEVFNNYGYTIEENQNIFFLQSVTSNPVIPWYELTVFFLFVLLLITVKKTNPIDWFLAITFSLLGGSAIRNFPLFVFATFIPFTIACSHAISHLSALIRERLPSYYQKIYLGIGILLLSVFAIDAISLSLRNHFGGGLVSGAGAAADFYLSHQIKGPVFNNFDIGSYLEYRIYPKQQVFVDGRPEAYPADFFQKIYIPMQQDQTIFARIDAKYHFNSIFFAHTDQTPWASLFISQIITNPSWSLVYLDDTVAIFLKNIPQNMQLIRTYTITSSTGAGYVNNRNNTDLLFQLAHFYYEAGWKEKELSTYNRILDENPKDCNALYNSLTIIQSQPNLSANTRPYGINYRMWCL